jgi:protein phosphatase
MPANAESRLVTAAASGAILGDRPRQQDRVLADPGVLLVADGVGAQDGSDLAATVAASAAYSHLTCKLRDRAVDVSGAITTANRAVRRLRRYHFPDATCTLTAAVLHSTTRGDAYLSLGWLGDSPTWLLRSGTLQQLTRPHNGAQSLAEDGWVSPDDVSRHPAATRLTRAVGIDGADDPELLTVDLRAGDRVLVASDGLAAALPTDQIADLLHHGSDVYAAVRNLLAAAEVRAEDNVAVAVAFVGTDDHQPALVGGRMPVADAADDLTQSWIDPAPGGG